MGIVAVYLTLNVVVIAVGLREIIMHPEYFPRWANALHTQHGSPVMMLAAAFLVFPKLALGLSGFETGVAVMPLVKGDPGDRRSGLSAGFAIPGNCCAPPRSS